MTNALHPAGEASSNQTIDDIDSSSSEDSKDILSGDERGGEDEMITRKTNIPCLNRQASFKPETLNEDKRTVELTFTTGARVKRFGFFSDDFHEELATGPSNVRLDRLNNGAALLNNHRAFDLDDVIGVVEKARMTKGLGVATVRFSKSERGEKAFQGVKEGVLRNISVGYRVHRFEEQEPEEDGLRIFRAVDWEPMELSLVTIPADSGAQVRNSSDHYPCNFVERKEQDMERRDVKTAPDSSSQDKRGVETPTPPVDENKIRQDAIKAERERCTQIRSAATSLGLGEEMANKFIEEDKSVDEARAAMIEERAKRDKETDTRSQNIEVTREEDDRLHRDMVGALLHRADNRRHKLDDGARRFRALRLEQMLRLCLERQGVKTGMMTTEQCWRKSIELHKRSVHSTSDFPLILEDTLNKTLRDSYDASPSVWQPIVRETTVSDFKEISRTQLGDAPTLKKLAEGAEIEQGTMGEQAEKFRVETFARKVRISRVALVNDDLSAFTRLPEMFGRRARDLENDLVWVETIIANPLLADGIALFDAAAVPTGHGNLLSGAGSSLIGSGAVAAVSAARAAMRKQKSLTSNNESSPILVTPSWLFVPPELETEAEQIISTSAQAAGTEQINPFAGRLRLAVEPRLSDGVSGGDTRWFLASDVSQIDIIEMARLAGEEGPVIESEDMFDMEGMQIKARMDVGVKAIDFRGLVRNEGA